LKISASTQKQILQKLGELKQLYPQIDPASLLIEVTYSSHRINDYVQLGNGLQLGPATTFSGILAMLWLFHVDNTGVPWCSWEKLLEELGAHATCSIIFGIRRSG